MNKELSNSHSTPTLYNLRFKISKKNLFQFDLLLTSFCSDNRVKKGMIAALKIRSESYPTHRTKK